MYASHFGLKLLPFKVPPDPTFIYWNPAHMNALSILRLGLMEQSPITLVTGEVGVGKTTVLLKFLEESPDDLTVGLISNFTSGSGNLYSWVLNAFGLDANGTPIQLFSRLQDFLIAEYGAGRRGLIIVDEAQNVSDEDLEQLRMLTNINTGKDALVLLCLVGQPQLRDRLLLPQNRQIAQRIGAAFHLGPMDLEETKNYIRHRLRSAGAVDEVFDDDALDLIYEATGGIPRVINIFCNMALVFAFGDGNTTISGAEMATYLLDAKANGYLAHVQPQEPPNPPPAGPVELHAENDKPPEPPSFQRRRIRNGRHQPFLAPVLDTAISEHAPEKDEAVSEHPARVAEYPIKLTPLVRAKKTLEEPAERDAGPPAQIELDQHSSDALRNNETSPVELESPGSSTKGPLLLVSPLTGIERSSSRFGFWFGMTCAVVGIAAVGYFVALPRFVAPMPSILVPGASLESTASAVASGPAHPIAPTTVDHLADANGAELMEAALNAGVSDPAMAALNYARAALRGEALAAYYLGQMYETGDGVPLNTGLARAWYGFGTEQVRSAQRRLAELQEPQRSGAIAAPELLLGGPLNDGRTEFVWSSGDDLGPAHYLVEVAADINAKTYRFPPQPTSAFLTGDVGDAKVWRVIAFDRDSGSYAVSAWRAMGAAPETVALIGNQGVRTNIVIEVPETMPDTAVADATARLTLPNTDTTTIKGIEPAPTETTVLFAFEADRATAQYLAERIGGGATADQTGAAARNADTGMLPGQIILRLAAP